MAAKPGKTFGDGVLDGRIKHQPLPQHAGHRLAGVVIAGGAESAGGDDDLGPGPAFAELGGDGGGLVVQGHVTRQLHAAAAQLGPDPGEVGVGGEAEQQLVAKSEEFETRRRFARAGAQGFSGGGV